MHRREDLYGSDAAEFRPERWETIRPGWEYLPFNGGPRICLGRKSFFLPTMFYSHQVSHLAAPKKNKKRGGKATNEPR